MNNLSITIAIPVFNEQDNIVNLLSSIIHQKESSFMINRIIVLSDGSTDQTVEKVKSLHDSKIQLIEFKQRKGKSYHMNTLFKLVDSEILVMFDGDVVLKNNMVINNLIQPFRHEKNIGLVSGDFQPNKPNNFIEKANKATIDVFEKIRWQYKGGHNVLGCTGRIMALSKKFYKKAIIPEKMVLNDIYTYFLCKKMGFEFRHAKTATVYYQLPTTLHDYVSQFKRFAVGEERMKKIFGDLYDEEYNIPTEMLGKLKFQQFLKSPVHCLSIFLINAIAYRLGLREIKKMTGKWEMATTTKKLV